MRNCNTYRTFKTITGTISKFRLKNKIQQNKNCYTLKHFHKKKKKKKNKKKYFIDLVCGVMLR